MRRSFQESVVRKLSLMLSTILWNFGSGIARDSASLMKSGKCRDFLVDEEG